MDREPKKNLRTMTRASNRKKPLFGIIHECPLVDKELSPSEDIPYNFVDVYDMSLKRAMVEPMPSIAPGNEFPFMVYNRKDKEWIEHTARMVAEHKHQATHRTFAELELLPPDRTKDSGTELGFLLSTGLLRCLSGRSLLLLVNCLRKLQLDPGEILIRAGCYGEGLYIVRHGALKAGKPGQNNDRESARLREGDIVGELTMLTQEPEHLEVTASTEAAVYFLDRKRFENLCAEYPDLRVFLTELLTYRFETWTIGTERRIGKYVLQQKIGTGGWAIVYRGKHDALDRPAAVKMMKHDMAMEPQFLETFMNEAKTIALLSHQNIVQIFDIEQIYRTIFIAMEYLEGKSLRELLDEIGHLDFERAALIITQICRGLDYAHKKGIVHRDIKPDNIMLVNHDEVKILDFGLACAPGTEDMSIPGTVHYAPPEQIDGDPVGPRSDIYSLGIMAYEMITGSRPYPEDNLDELMDLHCEKEIPDPAEFVTGLPGALRQFVIKACRVALEERYPDAESARLELSGLVPESEPPVESVQKRKAWSVFIGFDPELENDASALVQEFKQKIENIGGNLRTCNLSDL